jgi:hypothetical protein
MSRPSLATARATLAVALVTGVVRAAPGADSSAAAPAPEPTVAPSAPVPSFDAATPVAPVVNGAAGPTTGDKKDKLPFRHSWLVWSNAVNAQTLGVGHSYQSANPTYEMSGSFRPRYYLYDGDQDGIYAEARFDVIHEFTNSDVTTERGETTFSDATLLTAYTKELVHRGDYATYVGIRAPVLTLPTSKFSLDNGTILGLGTEFLLSQEVPLAGSGSAAFQSMFVRARAGYNHTFTRAVVPTNPNLRRVRLDPEGQTVPGDQLTGAAFPEHEMVLGATLYVNITDSLGFLMDVEDRPTWKYGFGDVCVTTLTGCVNALPSSSPNTFVVVTSFQAELDFNILPKEGIWIDAGYVNVETQPGPDGQRRSIFSSPGAQFYFDVTAYLDQLYLFGKGRADDATPVRRARP